MPDFTLRGVSGLRGAVPALTVSGSSGRANNQVDVEDSQLYIRAMPVHLEVLEAARRLCRESGRRSFRVGDVVKALPHLNESSVRTHIVSRCCVNAPSHHPHRWPYFRRVARGEYEIQSAHRRGGRTTGRRARQAAVAESAGASAVVSAPPVFRDTVHSVVTHGRGWYVAECLEIAVVTQARTLDELVENLREAVSLHLSGEDRNVTGIAPDPRISLTYDFKSHRA
jgi:predicted RNase H-like HicB family nuclease